MKVERICYWILIFALGILLLRLQLCSGRKPCPTITMTSVIHDTVIRVDSSKTEHPVPVSRIKKKLNEKFFYDTIFAFCDTCGYTMVDTLTLSDLIDLKTYSNRYTFGLDTVIVKNEVEYNELQNQKVTLKTTRVDSTIYVTENNTIYKEKQKVILYFGAGMYGNKTSAGGILSLGLKTKKDLIYSIGRLQGFGNDSYWYGQFNLPIKFKK